jgi:hypothetical protein
MSRQFFQYSFVTITVFLYFSGKVIQSPVPLAGMTMKVTQALVQSKNTATIKQ